MSDRYTVRVEGVDRYTVNYPAGTGPQGPASTDASALTSGTLPDARLSDNVLLFADLLSATSRLVTERSGGPPAVGAVEVSDSSQLPVWSALLGEFLLDESGAFLADENGALLIG
jgi:hypothetical protein